MAVVTAALSGCEGAPVLQPDRPGVATERPRLPPVARREPTQLQLPSADDAGEPVARVVERGTGTFVTPPSLRSRASVTEADGEITLNVVDAELREVVRLVLEDALGVNYVIDPSVGGRITVQTTRPIPRGDLVAVLDAVLRMNGAAVIQSGDLYQIVPIEQAMTSGPTPELRRLPGAARAGFGIQVVPLRFVSASEMARLLEPFAPLGGTVQVDPGRNLLLLAGSSEQLASLNDLVAMFDVDWLEGMSFGLFPLDVVSATVLVEELDRIFGDTQEGPLAGVVRFVPIARLNAVLVITSQPAYLSRAETWIERLDRVGEVGEDPQIYVYAVQNGRAANLAEVLGQIFEAETGVTGEPSLLAPGLEPVALRSTERFESGFADSDRQPGAERAERREAPEPSRIQRPAPGGRAPSPPAPGARPGTAIRIIADDSTNSLVIRATPRDFRMIREALDKLDILPLQVLIEATIVEVTLSDALRYGVEWFFRSGDFAVTFSQRSLGAVRPFFPGFAALFSSDDVSVVLNALEQVTDVNVISSPQLLVLDNQTARLQVGDQVPITVQQSTSVTDPDAPIVSSVELRDTGVILTVTPRVNAGGLVVLEIQQEVSNVVRSETDTASEQATPTINQRQISSTVAVESGETVALGGLITDERDRSRSGVPILSRIPILGALFSTRSSANNRTELLVLLTPSVIGSKEEARAVTEELRRRMRATAPLTAPGR